MRLEPWMRNAVLAAVAAALLFLVFDGRPVAVVAAAAGAAAAAVSLEHVRWSWIVAVGIALLGGGLVLAAADAPEAVHAALLALGAGAIWLAIVVGPTVRPRSRRATAS